LRRIGRLYKLKELQPLKKRIGRLYSLRTVKQECQSASS